MRLYHLLLVVLLGMCTAALAPETPIRVFYTFIAALLLLSLLALLAPRFRPRPIRVPRRRPR
jgi:heme A synthase